MKVILQQTVQKLGNAGDVVEASPGYFRNFLEPRKLAHLATAGTLKKREEDLAVIKKKAEAAHQVSVGQGEKITALGRIHLNMKAGDTGKLYGKVTTKEIALALQKAVGFEIDKRSIRNADEIGALGSYPIIVKLTPDVQAELTVEVLQEGQLPSAPVEKAPKAAEVEENADDNADDAEKA
ncbi:MAG: 50S ribosomal protein L9 [Candidatus Obscuribacterales bacterium]|nr:50S ribosomal protein L9 [Candidatus Obscuribacterales bacterium]